MFNSPTNEGSKQKTEFRSIENGDNIYRILPALSKFGTSNKWAYYYAIHFGYKGTDGKQIPFVSPEVRNFKSGMIEVEDPALERVRITEANYEATKNKILEIKKDPTLSDAIKDEKIGALSKTLKNLVELKKQYNMQKRYHVNAVDLDGNVVKLEMPGSAKKDLQIAIDKLKEQGIDALSPTEGRYFVFNRTGEGFGTKYTVSEYQKDVYVESLKRTVKDVFIEPFSEAMLAKINAHAVDLANIYTVRPTAEEVAYLVANESPQVVDQVLGSYKKQARAAYQARNTEALSNHNAKQPVITPVAQKAPDISFKADPIQVVSASNKTFVQTPAPAPVITPVTKATSTYDSMSEDDFLNMVENG